MFRHSSDTYLVRTVVNDFEHGSEMQRSTFLHRLHQVAMEVGHSPTHWSIGADNTGKETHMHITLWLLIWLLCALESTPLWMIDALFVLVSHTHRHLTDYFFKLRWLWQAVITSRSWACLCKCN